MEGLHTVEYVPTWKTRKGGHLPFKVFCRLCSLAVVVTVADVLLFCCCAVRLDLLCSRDVRFQRRRCQMKRVLVILMAASVVCGGLIGCANSPKEISGTMGSVVAEEENSVRNAISDTEDADMEEPGAEEYSGETIEYALSTGGIFVLNSDGETVEPLDLYALSFHALDDERDACIGGNDPIVLDR